MPRFLAAPLAALALLAPLAFAGCGGPEDGEVEVDIEETNRAAEQRADEYRDRYQNQGG